MYFRYLFTYKNGKTGKTAWIPTSAATISALKEMENNINNDSQVSTWQIEYSNGGNN